MKSSFTFISQRIDIINRLGCCWTIYNAELSIYQQMCYGHRVMYIQILLAWWISYRTPKSWFQVLFISSEWIWFMLFDHVLTKKIYLYLLYELNCNQGFNFGLIRNMILSTIHSTLQKFYHIDFSLTTKSTCMVFSYYLSWTVEICIMNYIHYPLLCLPLVTVTHRLQF